MLPADLVLQANCVCRCGVCLFVSYVAVEDLIVAVEFLFLLCFAGGIFVCRGEVFACVAFYGGVFKGPVLRI